MSYGKFSGHRQKYSRCFGKIMCTDVYHSSKSKVTVVQNTRLGGKGKSLVSQRRFSGHR